MQLLDVIQRSPEWLECRKGVITSSRISDVVSFRKDGKESSDRRKMKLEILQEIITGRAVEHYVSPAMEFGMENEARARAEYEIRTNTNVDLIGFVLHHRLARCGCSPDGMVGTKKFAEFKVPNTQTHLEYLASGVVPSEYIEQMQWQMGCTEEIEVNDFVSFDPRLPEELQMLIIPVERDNKKIAELENGAVVFLEEVLMLWEKLKRNAKHQSLEDKLRASIKQAKGYPESLEITDEDAQQFTA